MKDRIPLSEADQRAKAVVAMLSPFCERIAIAGSIRRRREDVGDIEIVCVPKVEMTGMFCDEPLCLLTHECNRLLAQKIIAHRLDKNGRASYGAKFKRLTVDGFPLDLFSTTTDQFGVIFAIRTGPSDWSKRLVTRKEYGGMMPAGMCISEGWLMNSDQRIPCREERDLFAAIGAEWVNPQDRI